MTPHLTVALRDIVILIVNTGLRIGEVLHLEWSDIKTRDGRKVIEVREKPNCPTKHGMGWDPKWGVERDVELNATALWVLENQQSRETVGFIPGSDEPVPAQFVFPRAKKTGRRRDGNQRVVWARCDNIRHQWNAWLRRAGLFYDGVLMERFGIAKGSYHIHDLRRSFNTYSIEIAGLTQNQASTMMGNDPQVNLEHYTNVLDTEVQRKIENLPFNYREISPSDDVTTTKEGRRSTFGSSDSVTVLSQDGNQTNGGLSKTKSAT